MKDTILNYLLEKIIFRKINENDFFDLKDRMKGVSDEEMNVELKTIWDEFDDVIPMDPGLKRGVIKRIGQQILLNERSATRSIDKSWKHAWIRIAAIIAFPLLFAFGSYYFFAYRSLSRSESFIVLTEPGQKLQLLLPDSTHVWLNSNSKLIYSSDFNKKNRKVKLEGEGFFDVHKSEKRNFVVETERVNVTVYGTAFNISSYAEDSVMQVSLLRGKVVLEDKFETKRSLSMEPDQLVSIDKNTNKWDLVSCDAEIESLWIRNQVKFEDASIDEVYDKLKRWYGLNIHVEKNGSDIKYRFALKNESIREILDLINRITPITYTIDGKEVQITYK